MKRSGFVCLFVDTRRNEQTNKIPPSPSGLLHLVQCSFSLGEMNTEQQTRRHFEAFPTIKNRRDKTEGIPEYTNEAD